MHLSFYENRAGALFVKPTEYFFLVFLLLLSLYRVVFVKSNTFYLELYNENVVNTQTENRLAQKKLKKGYKKARMLSTHPGCKRHWRQARHGKQADRQELLWQLGR